MSLKAPAIPERLRGVFTMRRYTNPRLRYLSLPYLLKIRDFAMMAYVVSDLELPSLTHRDCE